MNENEITVFTFYPEKKDYVTRAACANLLREIKSQLSNNKSISVIILNSECEYQFQLKH